MELLILHFLRDFFFLQSTKVEALGGTPEIATLLAVCDGFSLFVVRFCVPIFGVSSVVLMTLLGRDDVMLGMGVFWGLVFGSFFLLLLLVVASSGPSIEAECKSSVQFC